MKVRLSLAVLLALCVAAAAGAAGKSQGLVESKLRKNSSPISGRYIAVLEDWAAAPAGEASFAPHVADDMAANVGGKIRHVYKHALQGFSIEMSETAAEFLSKDPRVKFIEEDGRVRASATQANPPWGLDRIDQRDLPLSTGYTYNWTGSGVRVYVIDTGIRTSHTQFGGRASNVYDAFGGGSQDCNGHGTHVAGTVGGSTYGVAKSVNLRGVRVLDCSGSGSTSGVIAGVDWVAANHIKPAVANMSLAGGASAALDASVLT